MSNEPVAGPEVSAEDGPSGVEAPAEQATRERMVDGLAQVMRTVAIIGARDGVAFPTAEWHDLTDESQERYRSAIRNYLDSAFPAAAASESNPTPCRRASDFWNVCQCGHDGAVHDCLTNRCTACDCARFRQVRTTPTPANEPSSPSPHAAGRTTHQPEEG